MTRGPGIACLRLLRSALLTAALFLLFARQAEISAASGLTLTKVKDGFATPVFVTHAGDGSGRLFVVEKGGAIRILQDGNTLAAPFLDISDRVMNSGEAGLLGLAFPSDYETSGYFFVHYSHKDQNLAAPEPIDAGNNNGYDTVIARFRVTSDANVADKNSEERILIRNQPYTNHNGGMIGFGPDGALYIALGDGGSGGDPENQAQNKGTLLGKMLRITAGASGPYSIPADNPFRNTAGARPEIWDLGLRNPWRWSFDRANGDMIIGDVGQGAVEEVSFHGAGQPGGINFGWRCKEGAQDYDNTPPCTDTLTPPIAEYGRTAGNSITGGYVYRGAQHPTLQGAYFYGDFGSGRIWSMRKTGNGWTTPELELDTGHSIASFGEDEAGELYVVDIGGAVYRMTFAVTPAPDLVGTKTAQPADVLSGGLVLYTVELDNRSNTASTTAIMTDVLPAELTYVPGSLTATAGGVDAAAAPQLNWRGTVPAGQVVTVEYQAVAGKTISGTVTNSAQVTGPRTPLTLRSNITVTQGATANPDFFLPGTQPGHLVDSIANPAECASCHTAPIYGAWRGSMMSQSGRDPLMWAALHVAEADMPGAGEFCLRCHTPKGWFEGRSSPSNGSDLAAGVACETCHRMIDPVARGTTDEASARDAVLRAAIDPALPADHSGSGMMVLDPLDNRRGPFAIQPPPPHPRATWRTDFLGQGGNAVVESSMCAACHNMDNPALSWDVGRGQYWPNAANQPAPSFAQGDLFPLESTYDEWRNSAYATSAGVFAPQFAGSKVDGIVRSCQDCHMPRTVGAAAVGDVVRDCKTNGCLPEHELVGGNTWVPQLLKDSRWRLNAADDTVHLDQTIESARTMLQRSATMTVSLSSSGSDKLAVVRVTNESGHKLPSGYPEGRRMWLQLRAYDQDGKLLFTSGGYNPATGVLADDPQLKVYEVKQGITPELASVIGKPAGESFHFVLNNTVLKDNRIPPRGYTVAAFDRPGLRPVGATYADGQHWDDTTYLLPGATASVVAELYYQTASKAYVDFLRTRGGADGATLGQLWDDNKSPPELVAAALETPFKQYLPALRR